MYSVRTDIAELHDYFPGKLTLNVQVPLQYVRAPWILLRVGHAISLRGNELKSARRECPRARIIYKAHSEIRCREQYGILELVCQRQGIIEAEAAANRCLAASKRIPGEAHTRREVLQGGILKQ